MIHKNIISRPIYTQQILPWIGRTGIVKVYIGQRRSGKSTIMQMIVAQLRTQGVPDSDIICINCEDMVYSNLSHTDLYQHIHTKKHIFIDEIQDIPEWEKTIRSMVAQDRYDIHITGSNSNLLSSELSTYLSGRYIAFQIYPLSYTEYIQFRGISAGAASMTEYITYGGLPYIPDIIGSVSAVSQYLRSVYDTIVLHDIITRYSIRNIDFFNRLLVFLAQSIGDIFSAGSISRYLKSQKLNITVHGVIAYLEYARSACFLHKVSRYDILGKSLFEVREKYFFNDIGLRNILVGGLRDTDMDGILENLVFLEMKKAGWDVYVGEIVGKEIDFVAEKGGHKIYVQCMYRYNDKNTWERELAPFRHIPDGWPRYIVSLYEGDMQATEGVFWISASDFCTQKL